MGAALARLLTGGGDQVAILEGAERPVDERLGQRPHPADLTVGGHQPGDGEAVTWLLGEEAEHGPLAAGELGRARGRGGHTLTVAQPTNPGFATNAPERSNLGHNGAAALR